MASKAAEILKAVEDRMPAPLARQFGTPAAAAWTAIFVLVAAFALINWGVGVALDTVLHPAPDEVSAPPEPAGEPASVVVDLPPPLTPKVVPVVAPAVAPAMVVPDSTSQRNTRWDDRRRYRHGWGYRRWRNSSQEPAAAEAAVVPSTNHNPSPTNLLSGGLPKRVAGSGEGPVRKEAALVAPAAPKLAVAPVSAEKSAKLVSGPPAATAPKAGPPAAAPVSTPN